MAEHISNPDPESLDPEGDRQQAEELGYLGLESGAAPWVLNGTYPKHIRLHGYVRRVSYHDEIFTHRKKPKKMVTMAIEIPAIGQTISRTVLAVEAVGYSVPDAPVTLMGWPSEVAAGHQRLVDPPEYDDEDE